MKHLDEIVGAFFLTVLVALFSYWLLGCQWDRNPSQLTPVPGNPCGNIGVECGNHKCCVEGETCGDGKTGCPLGACCDVRQIPAFMKLDAGRD